MLQPKERAKLRGIASVQPDLVYIGQNGMTDNVVKQVEDNLHAHELIKIKVQKGSLNTPRELADQLATATNSEVVCVICNKIVLYRYSTKAKVKHVLETLDK